MSTVQQYSKGIKLQDSGLLHAQAGVYSQPMYQDGCEMLASFGDEEESAKQTTWNK
jgi:hypothetical protein